MTEPLLLAIESSQHRGWDAHAIANHDTRTHTCVQVTYLKAHMGEEQQQVPYAEAVMVEFPGIVRDVDAALAMLGGQAAAALRHPSGGYLQLRFRPADPVSHPLVADRQPARGLLLRISRRVPHTAAQNAAEVPESMAVPGAGPSAGAGADGVRDAGAAEAVVKRPGGGARALCIPLHRPGGLPVCAARRAVGRRAGALREPWLLVRTPKLARLRQRMSSAVSLASEATGPQLSPVKLGCTGMLLQKLRTSCGAVSIVTFAFRAWAVRRSYGADAVLLMTMLSLHTCCD